VLYGSDFKRQVKVLNIKLKYEMVWVGHSRDKMLAKKKKNTFFNQQNTNLAKKITLSPKIIQYKKYKVTSSTQ
jgi:hypothetical protein